ncbi:MAG: type I 3-dehydroquinate dehydratase, partial [Planctomycetota bacterium]
MPTLVCVPITVAEVHSALDAAHLAQAKGADLVEYRIDTFFSGSGDAEEQAGVLKLVRESPLPCVVTCRPTWEGGDYDGDDMERVSLFERLGTSDEPGERPRYLDVELAALTRSANLRQKVNLAVDHPKQVRDLSTSLILSSHDFEGRPPDLTRRLLAMADEDSCKVAKLAYRARSLRDNLDVFDLLRQARDLGKPAIALAMGEFGLMSRVLAPKFGAFLTFASLRDESATAPGQPTIDELLGRYRFSTIGASTRLYGVIGWPVAHSRGPEIHNAAFESAEWDGVYLPLPIAADAGDAEGSDASFKATLLALLHEPGLGFAGASVTLPHKERLVALAEAEGWTISAPAAVCGAANTIVVERDAQGEIERVSIDNTDAPAAGTVLGEALDGLRGRRIVIIGAGGVARGVAAACIAGGAQVSVHARRVEQAQRLADDLGPRDLSGWPGGALDGGTLEASSLDDLAEGTRECPDAYVNATPIGMSGGPDPEGVPLPTRVIEGSSEGCVFFDTVYTPRTTPMLAQAAQAGRHTRD